MSLECEIRQILDDDHLDNDDVEVSREELIQPLIERHGWEAVQKYLIKTLVDSKAYYRDWETASGVFMLAAFDRRPIDEDMVIGLVWHRLKPDEGAEVSNQAWSLACILRKLDYNCSNFNPRLDSGIIKAMSEVGIDIGRWNCCKSKMLKPSLVAGA